MESYSNGSAGGGGGANAEMKVVHLGGHHVSPPIKPVPSLAQFATMLIHADAGMEKVRVSL